MISGIEDTIVAIASPSGGAVRGIVRLTGPRSIDCASQNFIADAVPLDQLRQSSVSTGSVRVRDLNQPIPCSAYVWPGTRSYTRQPSVELHLPGSPPLLSAVVQQLCRHGARLAKPGEFTLRAFLAGRIDLTQADAVLGIIDAADQAELGTALKQMAGGAAAPFAALRNQVLDLLAQLEAGLDFVEEDIRFIEQSETRQQLAAIRVAAQHLASQLEQRHDTRWLPRVVLCGPPNAGKSSLFNALCREDVALVADQAGTTRDYLTKVVTYRGIAFQLIDTAGVDEAPISELDRQARHAGSAQRSAAQLTLQCVDASLPIAGLTTATDPIGHSLPSPVQANTIVVRCKSDLANRKPASGGICTSTRTGSGLTELLDEIVARLTGSGCEAPILAATLDRSRDCLRRFDEALERAAEFAAQSAGDELIAMELRLALDELGQIVGAFVTDDLLDRIFSRFCIGK